MRDAVPLVNLDIMWLGTILLVFVACAVLSLIHAHDCCANDNISPNHKQAALEVRSLENAPSRHMGTPMTSERQTMENNYVDKGKANTRWMRMQRKMSGGLFSKSKKKSLEEDLNGKGLPATMEEYPLAILQHRAGKIVILEKSKNVPATNRMRTPGSTDLGHAEDGNLPPLSQTSLPRTRVGVDFLADLRWRFERVTSNPLEFSWEMGGEAKHRMKKQQMKRKPWFPSSFRLWRSLRNFRFPFLLPSEKRLTATNSKRASYPQMRTNTNVIENRYEGTSSSVGNNEIATKQMTIETKGENNGRQGYDSKHSQREASTPLREKGRELSETNLFHFNENISHPEGKFTTGNNAIRGNSSKARAGMSLNFTSDFQNGGHSSHYNSKKDNNRSKSSINGDKKSTSSERYEEDVEATVDNSNNEEAITPRAILESHEELITKWRHRIDRRKRRHHQRLEPGISRRVRSAKPPPPPPTTGNTKNLRARREGDAIIGALFPLHQTPTQKTAYTRQCGKIREYYGIQRVEAFLMTLENINNDPAILPDIKLGWDIRDSCWYSAIALENSIDFIKDAIASQSVDRQKAHQGHGQPGGGQDRTTGTGNASSNVEADHRHLYQIDPHSNAANSSTSSSWGSSSDPGNQTSASNGCVQKGHLKPIAGLVGPGSSEATIQVQNLLQIFNIPQIGYSATSIDLSDKSHYNYFLRVVPPDRYQAQALVDVVVNFNWTYISTVHSDGNYGIKGMEMFTDLAREKGVCTATIDNVASTAGDEAFDEVVTNLLKTPNATVVVCFCEGLTVRNLFRAMRRRQVAGRFTIVGSDGWGNRLDVVRGLEATAVGGISIKLYSPPFRNFSSHYSQLGPDRTKDNPWFHSFWEQKFNCSLDTRKQNLRGYPNFCSGRESLAGSDQDSKLGFVVNAVTTMAKALHNMREDLCPGSSGLCSAMDPINGSVYLNYLLNVSFLDYSDEHINFDKNGDPPGRYEILNYQGVVAADGNVSYRYVTIGHWMIGKLKLNERLVQWPAKADDSGAGVVRRPVKSVCSEPCGKDQAKKVKGVECCWICATCLDKQILVKNNTDCQTCELGFWPNDNKTDCEIILEEFISWEDTQAIVCLVLGGVGICWTVWVAFIFIRFHETPVVKASTRELSYIILVGIGLAFSANVFIVAKPKKEFCYLTRILPGLSFSLIYGALVTKTNRIARILEGSKRIATKKPRFMSASAQVVITGMIIGMECAVITGMLIYQPANSKLHYPEPRRVRLVCDTSTLGIVVPLGFDLVLILLCTLYAVKTRNLPENFNEAKFIGFTMYATCVIWLGFFPIYFAGENKEVTLSLSISLSAAIALVLLFVPKVYVIIWVPERNTRGAFATSRDVRCHIGSKSMASGDSIDIKFVMQRVSDPEHPSPYVNHGVLGKKTHLGSCGILTKISKDSTRTESSHMSAMSTCSEKDRVFQNEASPSELTPSSRSAKLRPASPSEKEKHRIHNASRDDQQFLENIKMTEFENCRVVPAYFRKSLSSTCVSSAPKTRTVQCQTSDDLAKSLLPSLRRRRCESGGKHRLVRSSAVDDANCEMLLGQDNQQLENSCCAHGGDVLYGSYGRTSGSPRFQGRSHFSERDRIPFVLDQSANPMCVCGSIPGMSTNRLSPNSDSMLLAIGNREASAGSGGGGGGGSGGGRLFRSRDPEHRQKVSTPSLRMACSDVSTPSHSQASSMREAASLPLLQPKQRCPLHEASDPSDSLETKSISFSEEEEDEEEDRISCSCTRDYGYTLIADERQAPSSCHVKTRQPLRPTNASCSSGSGPFPSSSFFQPIHSSRSHSHSISSASSSSTLPPFNTSTESTKSNHSCFAPSDTNTNEESIHNFISIDSDEEDDEEDDDDFADELSPLRLDSLSDSNKGSAGGGENNAPLHIFVQEENDMLEFQNYLKGYGVKLDLSSVQSSDL